MMMSLKEYNFLLLSMIVLLLWCLNGEEESESEVESWAYLYPSDLPADVLSSAVQLLVRNVSVSPKRPCRSLGVPYFHTPWRPSLRSVVIQQSSGPDHNSTRPA
jgi:hypothetical protein